MAMTMKKRLTTAPASLRRSMENSSWRLGALPDDDVPRSAADRDFDGQLGIQQRIHALTRRQPGR